MDFSKLSEKTWHNNDLEKFFEQQFQNGKLVSSIKPILSRIDMQYIVSSFDNKKTFLFQSKKVSFNDFWKIIANIIFET